MVFVVKFFTDEKEKREEIGSGLREEIGSGLPSRANGVNLVNSHMADISIRPLVI